MDSQWKDLAQAIAEEMSASGQGPDGKKQRRKSLGQYAIVALLATGGSVGASWLALRDQARENTSRIEHQEAKSTEIEGEIGGISVRLGQMETAVGDLARETKRTADGVDALKEENLSKLRDTISDQRRELNRLRRRRRGRPVE